MKKLIYTIFALVLFVGLTNAQEKNYLGVGGELAFASGNVADFFGYSTGFGGSVRYERELSSSLTGYTSVGYLVWSGDKSYDYGYGYSYNLKTTFSAIVVMAGGKWYFMPGGLYGVGEVGYNSFSMSVDGGESVSSVDSKVGFGAGVGYEFPLGSMSLDVSAMYKLAATDFNYIGLRVGVKFGL